MSRSVKTKITKKVVYSTFKEYLETEGLDNCLPGMPSIEHGLSVYYKYYTKEDEENYYYELKFSGLPNFTPRFFALANPCLVNSP
jgi:ASC-1-like (ASCH) protein